MSAKHEKESGKIPDFSFKKGPGPFFGQFDYMRLPRKLAMTPQNIPSFL